MKKEISKAIEFLSNHKIEAFELMGILVIPASDPQDLDTKVSNISKLLKQCGYTGSWRIDPYYYENHPED